MKLKCQLIGSKCPPYSHKGEFYPSNETLTGLLPDLRRCANCIAYEPPSIPSFRDDLIQIASITLMKRGPEFDPYHKSGASFGSFIRPRICISLANARRKELKYHSRERSGCFIESDVPSLQNCDCVNESGIDFISNTSDVNSDCFVDSLIWDISVDNFGKAIPELIKVLTHREQQVFACIREDMPNCDIAKMLNLSQPRISQLSRSIEQKLRKRCQSLGLVE